MNEDLQKALLEGLKDPRIREFYEKGGEVLRKRGEPHFEGSDRNRWKDRPREKSEAPPLVI